MEEGTLACISLFVLTTLIRDTLGTTDAANTSIAMDDLNATDDAITTVATNLTATDNNITESTDNVVLVKYLGVCCWYSNAGCAGNNTVCSSCICRCQGNHVYNHGSKNCEAVGGQAGEGAGSKVGDGLPGQPCTSASQCVEGLVCNSTTCACPWPCVYVEEELMCDCGEELYPLIGPIVSGIILSLIIIIFWCSRIYCLIERYKEQNKVSRLSTSVSGISTLGAAYGTDHIVMNPIRSQPHSLAYPRPHNQTVAPIPPLNPAFRYTTPVR